jgi:MoaA/NifB/PqqE/SkfB family radical SAM enzyme
MKKIKSMNITFGYACNNNCIHCYIGEDSKKQFSDRTTKELKEILIKAKKEHPNQIIFIGGEVTIRKDFFELLQFAKDLDLRVHLETNGRAFCIKEFAKKTFSIMPDLDIAMSFHHTTPEVQDKITRITGSWEQSVTGIKNMKKYALKHLTIIPVITKFNYRNIPKLVKFLKKLKVDEIDFTLMRIGGNASKNLDTLFIPIKEIQPYLFEAIKTGKKLGIDVKTYGFPYCTIKNYENHAYEINFIHTFLEKETYVFNELHDLIDWQKERLRLKSKLSQCKSCKYFFICEGVWKEYIDISGTEELTPIEGKQIKTFTELHKMLEG